ncbi:hypothetical protein [Sorangium sp. So ce362]|uniref:hypothetical protein n=1 Tax=Sorangium sp. So ce362 TaxID=3133303 RepID=UPI003F60A186
MTPDEVRAAAGLIPFDVYARAAAESTARRHPGADPKRGTGRTTRMLCDALAAASEGRQVHIVAGRRWAEVRRAQLERQARGLALVAGIPFERVRVVRHDDPRQLWDVPREDLVLHDHE